ncbi:hypothetical protein C7999DRAFT_42337 [Corynascus novoguineensis]|uniref:2-oxoadipate dioxygenase/decarboxylase n=1 Tax=Corynascus novoguineensis TaxID=1126955 RepID=A0AAN7CQV8_9PEZI|nr:hypothetical protein C7999DRAFT_42337 [Corynascus novoguineensis]
MSAGPVSSERQGPDTDYLRSRFVRALSDMYRSEAPLYGQLVDIVQSVDSSILAGRGQSLGDLPVCHQLERHSVIRVGTEHEMRMVSRLFGIMGMYPVGYFDLKMVGFPIHGTAFRPTREKPLRNNPFRVFTTVLRPDPSPRPQCEKTATDVLSGRTLFSPRLCELLEDAEQEKSTLTAANADELITESLKVFKWHSRSTVSLETYLSLKHEHPIVADIVCFPSAHINHLTLRMLDIDAVQATMIVQGLPAKQCIEGPPGGRKCEILLRQTSFKGLEERRGAAVTHKGRELYDRLLSAGIALVENQGRELDEVLVKAFREFPDDLDELRRRGLGPPVHMEQLLEAGVVECEPITYEDFLPFFGCRHLHLERVLGCEIPSEIDLYGDLQNASVRECAAALGLREVLLG